MAICEITARDIPVKQEFMTFFKNLDSVKEVEPEALAGQALVFGTPVVSADTLGGGKDAFFSMRLVVTYDIYAKGVMPWYGD